jgi:hypothetical protein
MSATKRSAAVCQCADHGCPVHPGMDCARVATREQHLVTLRRVDMDDRSGTRFCPPCAEDALASGLFT